ncbi:peptidylprolyl isomerase [Candidatus Omnitrophota bacterium]
MKRFKIFIFLALLIARVISLDAQVINKVVAVVNDEVITQQDVNQLLAVLYAQYVHTYKDDELLEKMEEVKKNILSQMIEDRLILSRAKELNIRVREDEISEKLSYVKNGFPSEEEFYAMLETQGITVANLKERYKDQAMMKKLVDFEIKSRVTVLPSEITEYYEKYRIEFRRDEKYKVRHILIKADDDVGLELAKVEASSVYAKLREGHDFAELAKEYSQGPNKERGGDMGYIAPGEMLKELNKAILSLKAGEFSEPIKSQIGYHVLKVEEVRAGYFSLEDVQGSIKRMLYQEKLKKKLGEWVDDLETKAYISIK